MKGVKGYRRKCRKHNIKLPDLSNSDSFHLTCLEPEDKTWYDKESTGQIKHRTPLDFDD